MAVKLVGNHGSRRRAVFRPAATRYTALVMVMEIPEIRSGAILSPETRLQLVVRFEDSAEANLAIQLLTGIGVPGDRLGVLPPEKVEGGRGMILVAGCPTEAIRERAEDACRKLGGQLHRHDAP